MKKLIATVGVVAATLMLSACALRQTYSAPPAPPPAAEEPEAPAQTPTEEPVEEPESGTRENPDPYGTAVTLTLSDVPTWRVSVGEPDWNVNREVKAENQFNDPPSAGSTYVAVPITYRYLGEDYMDPADEFSAVYVAPSGESYDDATVVYPRDPYDIGDLYTDGKGTGIYVFDVPEDARGGTVRVTWGYDFDFYFG